MYVAQKSVASVDHRIICRKQLLWLHFNGVGAGKSAVKTELDSEVTSPCVGDPAGFVECVPETFDGLGDAITYSVDFEELCRDVIIPMVLDVISPSAEDVSVALAPMDVSIDCEEVFEDSDGLRNVVP